MSDYVKGTVVKLTYTVKDFDTGQLIDPPDTSVTIIDRVGVKQALLYSNAEVYRMSQGKYRARVDTSPFSLGGCVYEIATTGTDASLVQGEFFLIAPVGS
jgi:hypothetical protein